MVGKELSQDPLCTDYWSALVRLSGLNGLVLFPAFGQALSLVLMPVVCWYNSREMEEVVSCDDGNYLSVHIQP